MENTTERVAYILNEIEDLKSELAAHCLYTKLQHMEDIHIFMEHHVFAVWDFMSLAKALQLHLDATQVIEKQTDNSKILGFVNGILTGGETDPNKKEIVLSHLEMYLELMDEIGANTTNIKKLIASSAAGLDIHEAMQIAQLTDEQQRILNFTQTIIATNEIHKIAVAATLVPEGMISNRFLKILKETEERDNLLVPKFKNYLNRYKAIDGNDYGLLSLEMVTHFCDSDGKKWVDILDIAMKTLSHRIYLWDAIVDEIDQMRVQKLAIEA